MAEEPAKDSPKLRDIREDLRARVLLIEKDIESETAIFNRQQKELVDAFRTKIEDAKIALAGYRRLLDLENRRVHDMTGQPEQPEQPATAKAPLVDFLCAAMADRGAKSKDELRDLAQAAGYFGPGDGGRAIHATMVNLVRGGRVRELSDGKFMVQQAPIVQQPYLLKRRV